MRELDKDKLRQEFIDLYRELDLKFLLNKIADKIRHYLNCAESSIFLYNERKDELYFEIATGDRQDELKKIVFKKGEGVVGWVAEQEKRLIINDCSKDPRFSPKTDLQTDFKTCSILGVPVIMDQKLLGILEAINKQDGKFDEADAEILEDIACYVTIPLQNAMFFKKITEETREKTQLIELGKIISRAFSLEEVFETIKQIIIEIFAPTEINVLVESQCKEYRLISKQTVPCEGTIDIEDTLVEADQVMFPLKSGQKRLGVLQIKTGKRMPEEMLSLIRGLSVFAAISLEKFEMATQMVEKEKIERELQIARNIQQSFLIAEKIDLKGMDVAYINLPSSKVGGDYYHIVKLREDETIFTIDDVSGHGIPASLLMAIFRTNFVYRIKKDKDMLVTLRHLNNLIAETTTPNHFVTSFTCKIDTKEKLLTYVRAGHNPPFICRGNKVIELKEGSHPIGWFINASYTTVEVQVKKNDLIVLYTDGLIEAENSKGEQFSAARFKEFIKANKHLDAETLKEKLIEALKNFVDSDSFEDDVTFILIKIL